MPLNSRQKKRSSTKNNKYLI